ncbi:MAG: GNAT family N-acetyltransferase [Limnochordaceae bacterium]|nr:GNAT family N-acetyltransferase [Limnochordaceae bacterium]
MDEPVVRPYRPGDEEQLVSLWNRSLAADPITLDRLVERVFLDVNFDPEGLLVAEADCQLVGFFLAVVRRVPLLGLDIEPEQGWIWAFGVSPARRRQGIGHRLLEAAEQFLRNRRRCQVWVAQYAPNYFFPGVDAEHYPDAKRLLTAAGYESSAEVVAMDVHLGEWQGIPAAVERQEEQLAAMGIRVETLTPRWLIPTLQLAEGFGPDWSRGIREGLLRTGHWERVILARQADQVLGYCMYGLYDRPAGRFGPFGVDPAWRGHGIGKVLLYRCLQHMKAEGLHSAWFLSTSEESPAGHLYQEAGFRVSRRFTMMRKQLLASRT